MIRETRTASIILRTSSAATESLQLWYTYAEVCDAHVCMMLGLSGVPGGVYHHADRCVVSDPEWVYEQTAIRPLPIN